MGIDGVMGGYLLLKGPAGLDVVDKAKFLDKKVPSAKPTRPAGAAFHVAVRRRPHFKGAAARFDAIVARPTQLADIVIADLARWRIGRCRSGCGESTVKRLTTCHRSSGP